MWTLRGGQYYLISMHVVLVNGYVGVTWGLVGLKPFGLTVVMLTHCVQKCTVRVHSYLDGCCTCSSHWRPRLSS